MKTNDGKFKAVNFTELAKQIKAINPDSLRSENAKTLMKIVLEMENKFGIDNVMLATVSKGKVRIALFKELVLLVPFKPLQS
jgi:hypothetical protein